MQTLIVSDSELVGQYLSGNESSLEILINRHKAQVFSHLRILVKDQDLANDLFQDTFIKVINTLRLGNYNEEGKFLPWVLRIAHNLAIDYFRKQKRTPTIKETDDFDIFNLASLKQANAEDHIVDSQIKSDVNALLNLLPSEQKEVVWMRCFCKMSFKEISEETGCSINTALGRMRYALINMRKFIKEKELVLTN